MVTTICGHDEAEVFVGLDVGKGEHLSVALARPGKHLFDKILPNHETWLRTILDEQAEHGAILLVV